MFFGRSDGMGREQKNELSKQKILNAALEEFGKNDYAVASTNSMCKKSGISKGLLFHYFKSKDELFLACAQMCLEALVSDLKAQYVKQSNDLEVNLNSYFQIRHTFFQTHSEYNQLFKNLTINVPEHLHDEIEVLKGPLKDLNSTILRQLMDEKYLKESVIPEEVIKVILSFSEYLVVSQRDLNEMQLNQQMVAFIKMIFYGVLRTGGEE